MIYDMNKPEHLAHFLNELPTKKIMQEHGRFYAKRKSAEFMAEVKKHMLEKTEIVSAKVPNAKDGSKFDGPDYNPAIDDDRLNKQIGRVYAAMANGSWQTLNSLEQITKDPQASISAQLRHLRKEKFGSHDVERRRSDSAGTLEYRLNGV